MKKTVSLIVLLLVAVMTVNCFAADVRMTDVDYNSDLGKSIEKLVKAGVISGIPQEDNTLKYEAESPVTRAEFCKMVNVTFGYERSADNIFIDVDPSKWYYIYVLPAIYYGYIQGYGDGRFGGEDYITREQVCTILSQILDKTSDKKVEIKDEVSSWAKPYVENMIALGYMSLEEDGKFRGKENMTRGELAFALDDFVEEKKESDSSSKPTGGGTTSGGSKPSGGTSSGGSKPSGGSSSSGSGSSSGNEDSPSEDIGTTGGSSSGNTSSGNESSGTTTPEPEPEPEPEIEYSISYELNGIGELPESAKTVYTSATLPYTLPVLQGTDFYVFGGWYTDSSFEGEAVKRIEAGIAENLVFYANWKDRYTPEELEASEKIYEDLEFVLNDMLEKEELEILEFDEKGTIIYNHLKNCASEVLNMKENGTVISNSYVRSKYQEQIKEITDTLNAMTTEERDAFEFEVNKLNSAGINSLIDLFDVNIYYGKE